MSILVFSVQSSSSDEVYRLEASRTDRGVKFTCTCPAGQIGQHCKHRISLLLGDSSSAIDVNQDAVQSLANLVNGSPIMDALQQVALAERELDAAKKGVTKAKKALGRVMSG